MNSLTFFTDDSHLNDIANKIRTAPIAHYIFSSTSFLLLSAGEQVSNVKFKFLLNKSIELIMEDGILSAENTAWLETEVLHGLRLWYISMFNKFSFPRRSIDFH